MNGKKERAEWCVKWLNAHDIKCDIKDDFNVIIYLDGGFNLDITNAEVNYRASLWAQSVLAEEL